MQRFHLKIFLYYKSLLSLPVPQNFKRKLKNHLVNIDFSSDAKGRRVLLEICNVSFLGGGAGGLKY